MFCLVVFVVAASRCVYFEKLCFGLFVVFVNTHGSLVFRGWWSGFFFITTCISFCSCLRAAALG